MSVLTRELTELGHKGYELDFDHAEKYMEPRNYKHDSGRMQRPEETDEDWQRAFGFAAVDLLGVQTRTEHDPAQWKDITVKYWAPGEMKLLHGFEQAQSAVRAVCSKFADLSYDSKEEFFVVDFREAWALAVANTLANKKLGMQLQTSRLIKVRMTYALHEACGCVTKQFNKALDRWAQLPLDKMIEITKDGGAWWNQSLDSDYRLALEKLERKER